MWYYIIIGETTHQPIITSTFLKKWNNVSKTVLCICLIPYTIKMFNDLFVSIQARLQGPSGQGYRFSSGHV